MGDQTKKLDANEKFEITIDSFQQNVNYSVKYEALPLTNLIINNEVVKTKPCNASLSWLNCLQTEKIDLQIEKCTNEYDLNITYEVDQTEVFSNATVPISIANYTNKIILRCKWFDKYLINEMSYETNTYSIN